jgi:hypothetical protein
MSQGGLPEVVAALLRDHLKSFEQLEVLLLLQARRDESWTVERVAAELHLDPDLIRHAMAGLVASGLLAQSPAVPTEYHYRPTRTKLVAAVDELVCAYREQRAALMSQMSTNAIERIRSGTLTAWADAFVIRKRKDDG